MEGLSAGNVEITARLGATRSPIARKGVAGISGDLPISSPDMEIRQLRIHNFRGFGDVVWYPHAGVNCLVGPGDSGKSTLLDAIALLLSSGPRVAVEYDYRARDLEEGFTIEAVLGALGELPDALGTPILQGWRNDEVVPLPEGDDEPVLVVRATGSPDLDVRYEIVRADGTPEACRGWLRSALGLIRIDTGARAAGELRLARGTLLSQRIGKTAVRTQLTSQLAELSDGFELPDETRAMLDDIGAAFESVGLPREITLGLLAQAGGSVLGQLALHADMGDGVALPVANSGAGTRQTALFALASAQPLPHRTIVVDELETGLEPYRQRHRVARLRELVSGHGQLFMATHSPAVVSSLETGELWRLTDHGAPVDVSTDGLKRLIKSDGESLLSRLPVVCEGKTEQGLLDVVLPELAAEAGQPSPWVRGIHLVDGGGNESAAKLALALCEVGIRCGLLVDNEDRWRGTRDQALAQDLCVGVAWERGNTEEVAAASVPRERLDDLVVASTALGARLQQRLQQLGEAFGVGGQAPVADLLVGREEAEACRVLGQAMHKCEWFKTRAGGRTLGAFLIECGLPGEAGTVLRALWTALSAHL